VSKTEDLLEQLRLKSDQSLIPLVMNAAHATEQRSEVISRLIDCFDKDEVVASLATNSIAWMGHEAISVLKQRYLESFACENARKYIIMTLSKMGFDGCNAAVEIGIHDASPRVRVHVLDCIFKNKQAQRKLFEVSKMLDDSDSFVRILAAKVLLQVSPQDPVAKKILIDGISNKQMDVRRSSMQALISVFPISESAQLLDSMSDDSDIEIRTLALILLIKRTGDLVRLNMLLDLLNDLKTREIAFEILLEHFN